MPIDPGSDGTWVGVNEHGLALTLLNYNLPQPPTGRDQSRGRVIPMLLHVETVDELIAEASAIQAQRMMPFRLVACDGEKLLLWRSTEPIGQAEVCSWSREPVMYTSSGLGDHLVEGPRRELFEGWFGEDANENFEKQRAFHQHQWPGKEPLSINMYREDARTVSYTELDVESAGMVMRYYSDGPGQADPTTTHSLERRLVQR